MESCGVSTTASTPGFSASYCSAVSAWADDSGAAITSASSATAASVSITTSAAPIERVTGWDTPYPHSLEWAYFPGPVRLTRALEKVLEA